jgi:hypothetical protein
MKWFPIILVNALVSAAIVAGALLLQGPRSERALRDSRAADSADANRDVERRLASLDGRLAAVEAAVSTWGADLARVREATREDAAAAQADLVALRAAVVAGSNATAAEDAASTAKPPEVDKFAQEVSKALRQNISGEFKRLSDLILAPTPAAEEQRRRQLEGIAQMFGRSAGLDDGQVGTLQQILVDTDAQARDELRPVLQETDDYTKIDYAKVKGISANAFTNQDQRFDEAFPKDKADALKRQVAPIRTLFSAMLDELEKQGTQKKASE